MLHLEDERKARLYKITEIEGTEVKKTLKTILEKYDNVVSRRVYDIENYQTIKYTIRLLDETSVMGK